LLLRFEGCLLREAAAAACALALTVAVAAPAVAQEGPGEGPGVDDVTELDLESLLAAPDVEAASKRRQSLEEAPGAITVIQGSDLVEAGAVSLADVLRMVPGLWVLPTDANMFRVELRGIGAASGSPSVLTLINGRRFYELSNGFTPWSTLPVSVAEIERIEVLRGPGATLYGADAFNGVINIVTKHPKDYVGVEGLLSAGATLLPNDKQAPGGQRMNSFGRSFVAGGMRSDEGTLGARLGVGFGQLPEWSDITPDGSGDVYTHGHVAYHGSLTLDYLPSRDTSVWLDLRHVFSEAHMMYETAPAAALNFSEQSAVLSFERKRLGWEGLTLKLAGDIRRLFQSGHPQTLERYDSRNRTYHLVAQADLSTWDDRNILTVGLDAAYKTTGGWTGTDTSNAYGAALIQNETALFDRRLILNLAGRYEVVRSRSNKGGESTYVNLNPRLSAIVRVAKQHTLRASAATSYRTPTPFQAFVDIAGEPYDPPIPTAWGVWGNPSLRPEKLGAVELGYRGRAAWWLRFDATLFLQRATDLHDFDGASVPVTTINRRRERHEGIELGAQLKASEQLSGYLNYAFLHADLPSDPDGVQRFPPHILGLGASAQLPWRLKARGDFYFTSAITAPLIATDYKTVLLRDNRVVPRQTSLNLRLARTLMSGTAEVFAAGTNVLAPLRPLPELRLFPQDSAAPIGAVFLLGVELRPQ
jgi:iron complex outermembrane receptor protein